MKLKILVRSEMCGGGQCPTFWIDEDTGDFFLQGYKVAENVRSDVQCPKGEDLVRVPASFWDSMKEYSRKN